MRAHESPRWSTQDVEIGRITPAKPSPSSFFWSRLRFSRPQRTCSPVMTLPLPKRSCARLMPSVASIDAINPRVYRTDPTSSFGPVPWPLPCTTARMSFVIFAFGSAPCCSVSALYPLAPSPTSRTSGSAPPPHAVHLFTRVTRGHRLLEGGRIHDAPAPEEDVVGTRLTNLQPGRLLLDPRQHD